MSATRWTWIRWCWPIAVAAGGLASYTVAVADERAEVDPPVVTDFHVVGDGALPTRRPELRAPRAPLSIAETGYAVQVARSAAGPDATDVHGRPGPQLLQVELPSFATGQETRLAEVTLYDYTADRALQQVVDLAAGVVVANRTAAVLQPPPVQDEADAALDVALAAQPPLALEADFEAAQGVPLVAPSQVGYVAGTWIHDGSSPVGRDCGRHRCVRLLIRTPSGVYLDTGGFVVDLTTGSVVRLDERSSR